MLGSTALEVAIGLSLLYTLLSLVVTSAREALEGLLQTRAIHLERGIRELLCDQTGEKLTQQIFDHPYVSNLYRGNYDPKNQLKSANWWIKIFNWQRRSTDAWKRLKFRSNLPAYIPARNFALALLDTAARGAPDGFDAISGPTTFARLEQGVARLGNSQVRRALLIALEDADGDIDRARQNVEKWFNSSMDRVSGWYRKQTQRILLGLGLLVALLLNVDTLRIASSLYESDALRSVVVNEAEGITQRQNAASLASNHVALSDFGCVSQTAKASDVKGAQSATDCAKARLENLGYPIGWSGATFSWSSLPGWLLTAFALSLGAPFWFDLLNKMMVVRSTVKPDEKSPTEASKDKQVGSSSVRGSGSGGDSEGTSPPPPLAPQPASSDPSDTEEMSASGPLSSTSDPTFQPHQWSTGDPQGGDL